MQKGLKKYFINMDEYLSSLGLYRKMVARDASSLFRAVSEQLYYSQNYHQKIRQDCANFMRTNRSNFEPFVEGSFEKYLERLEDPKETVGQVEIKALSHLLCCQVMLCCSINGHYDIVYLRSYPTSAALCQSLLYELLYTQVFGVEEAELCQAMETFRVGGRRYRNSPSVCSDADIGYDTPEDRGQRYTHTHLCVCRSVDRAVADDTKPPAEAPPPSRLCLTYKVMKSLDGEVYRNLEFDVWQDTCKEMQKTDYMVFAGRQYFLGDKCQVRLEPKGKYYNAFIQEVGTHSSAVTVFIEELGEKHLVPLTDLKPVNPVPAWNVAAPIRKGDLDSDSRGQRHHRHRYFRKSRGSSGLKGAELLLPPPSSYGGSSTRFLNRHLIGPQLTYYHPGRRYYHDYENYTFRSRRSRRQLVAALNKECQFGFLPETVEEPADLDAAIAYYQLDDVSDFPKGPAVAPPPNMGAPPPGTSYRVQRGSGPLPPAPPPGNTPVCSSEEDQEDTSTPPLLSLAAMTVSASSPWLVNELGEPLCTMVAPPPYSYDPNGSDFPRDCRVLQYYFNLGVQVRDTQSCRGHPLQTTQNPPGQEMDRQTDTAVVSADDTPLLVDTPDTRSKHSVKFFIDFVPSPCTGPTPSMEGSSPSSISSAPLGSTPCPALLYPDQTPLPPPPMLHLPYEAPPPATYLPSAPHPAHPHPAHLPHHSSFHCLPPTAHWGTLQTGSHAPRVYCSAPNPTHVVGYITAPPPHHTATHYIPPTI
uniref:ubiquitinyl hydrolase 1 n=1 Tax=Seriola dumerili TaxID=41447 RepID=A0A3B4VH42_SERDU